MSAQNATPFGSKVPPSVETKQLPLRMRDRDTSLAATKKLCMTVETVEDM